MSSEKWKKNKLGDLVDIKHGFAFKGEFFSDQFSKYVLITPGNFHIGGGFKRDKLKFYTGPIPEEFILNVGDVIVTMTDLSKDGDTLGYSALVPDDNSLKFLHNQRIGLLQFKNYEVDRQFIYWLLRTKDYHSYVVNTSTGTTVKHTSPTLIRQFEFFTPCINCQRRIAAILGSIEEKIELNRQTNATLEAIAQAIFKEWFVDFNYPGATGDLVESELGPIPEGWRVKPLDEIAEFLNGLALQKYPPENETEYLPVIKIRELRNGVTESSDRASRNLPSDYIIQDGDLLFSWSGSLEVKFWVGGEGALNQHLFKVTSENYPLWFCYHWILYHLTEFRNIAEEKTTTMGHIKREHLSQALCVIPNHMEIFNSVMGPITSKTIQISIENRIISMLRDNLLQEIMNGNIDVSVKP